MSRKGYFLFVVLGIMMAMAILAFGFNALKRGTVEQLARSADQNRLALIAQAANSEMLAIIKSQANNPDAQPFFGDFRAVFESFKLGLGAGTEPWPFVRNYSLVPPETRKLADSYRIAVKSQVSVVVNAQVNSARSLAFTGHVEVISQAAHKSSPTMVEIKERRDLKLVDLRDFFDKYVLFVKNFCPDLNHPTRRIHLEGIRNLEWNKQVFSHVYLGNERYPEAQAGQRKSLSLDLSIENDQELLSRLFSLSKPIPMNGFEPEDYDAQGFRGDAFKVLFSPMAKLGFAGIYSSSGLQPSLFYEVSEMKKFYMSVVNIVANSILDATGHPPTAAMKMTYNPKKLKTKCSDAKNYGAGGANSGAYFYITDYINNCGTNPPDQEFGYDAANFSACTGFRDLITECQAKWQYHFGLTDADHLWKLNTGWLKADVLRVISDFSVCPPFSGFQPFLEFWGAETNPVNREKSRVGKMMDFFNQATGDFRPLLIEGDVQMRFFKVAFLDEFKGNLTLHSGPQEVIYPLVPLNYRGPLLPEGFSSKALNSDLFPYTPGAKVKAGDDVCRKLMSEVIEIPVNRILADETIRMVHPQGDPNNGYMRDYNPDENLLFPSQKGSAGVGASGTRFFPAVRDFHSFSHLYINQDDFLRDRVIGDTLYIDGRVNVCEGHLDLRKVTKFRGNGVIKVERGDCKFGAKLMKTQDSDILRIYLQTGSFFCEESADPVTICASLIAVNWDDPNDGVTVDPAQRVWQGKLVPKGNNVTIIGNLVVDYLFTEGDSQDPPEFCTPDGGFIRVIHDPVLFSPIDPFRISVGSVRSMYSMNTGGSTL